MTDTFRNRILGYATKKASEFMANPNNWRKHPQAQRDAVQASLRSLGWIAPVIENVTTGALIDGHERVWQALAGDEDVPYLQVELSEDEEMLALATFDPLGAMAEADAAILDSLLQQINTDEPALQALLADLAADAGLYIDENAEDAPYSRIVESPAYAPSGEMPAISELFDDSKTARLIAEIDASGASEEDKHFLRIAAQRHTILNFSKIADYYAHAGSALQTLMENSALVIIDFNRAIELGYVRLTQEIARLAELDDER